MAKRRDYNRPNQKWECGWARLGKGCSRGPDAKGHCHTVSECRPAMQGESFACTRLPQFGGPCERGPMPDGNCSHAVPPCTPVLSLRMRRALVTVGAVGASLGVLFIALGTRPSARHMLTPGPVSNHHSSIKNDCVRCHSNANGAPLAWMAGKPKPEAMTENCLSCHALDKHAKHAHGMNPEELKARTEALLAKSRAPASGDTPAPSAPPATKIAAAGFFSGHSAPASLQCATCHKEHRGSGHQLAELSNKQCQTCHAQSFQNLSRGHPDFKAYPFQRRARILFDHGSHFSKHFQENKREDISCATCHTPEASGQRMVVKGFEQSCAECHEGGIRGVDKPQKGLVVLRLPTLDLKTLQQKGAKVGDWPSDADGKLAPFQIAFLAADEKASAAFAKMAKRDLSDLSDADAEEIQAVETIVWGLKRMLRDLGAEGPEYLSARLKTLIGRDPKANELAGAVASLSPDVIRRTKAVWFPKLDAEIATAEAGRPPATRGTPSPAADDEADEAYMASGGWYRKTSDFTLRYRPTGHADAFLKSWLELFSQAAKNPHALAAFNGISDAKTPGSCVKCHSVDQPEGGLPKVNWSGKSSAVEAKGFNRFQHSAHFSLLTEKGCFTCHALDPKSDFEKNYEGRDPSQFSSNFSPIKKETCVTCHTSDKVDDDCQSCHNYHVNETPGREKDLERVRTKF